MKDVKIHLIFLFISLLALRLIWHSFFDAPIGEFINQFIACTTYPENKVPCYIIYDFIALLIAGIIFVYSLVIVTIRMIKHVKNRNIR